MATTGGATILRLGCDLSALHTNDIKGNLLNGGVYDGLVGATSALATSALAPAFAPAWNPTALAASFAAGKWNPLASVKDEKGAINSLAQFTHYKKGTESLRAANGAGDILPSSSTRVELVSEKLPLASLNIAVAASKMKNDDAEYRGRPIDPIKRRKSTQNGSFADTVLSLVLPGYSAGEPDSQPSEKTKAEVGWRKVQSYSGKDEETSECAADGCSVDDDGGDFWGAATRCKKLNSEHDAEDVGTARTTTTARSLAPDDLPPEMDCLPRALIMKSFNTSGAENRGYDEEERSFAYIDGNDLIAANVNNNSTRPTKSNWNGNAEDATARFQSYTTNNLTVGGYNSNAKDDPTARFQSLSTLRVGSNNLYQPSAISATVDRQGPLERYQYHKKAQCRVGGQGPPGVPAAGGYHSSRPATKEGIPWGRRKERRRPAKAINQEPYQTLKPSGHWVHGTKQKQPANKQAQATRVMAYPYYLPEDQKCPSRPEYRSRQATSGLAGSCKDIKLKKENTVDLDKVRCNCPGLYPDKSSHGPGNYWDEEDDDEAILAGMCPDDIEEECGQGQDGIFPLEEWADEWEDGLTSGECMKGRLAPGTLDLYPWENPCLEELQKRKRRIQELRNKRWAAIRRTKDAADRVKQDHSATPEQRKEAARKAEKVFQENSQKSWSLLGWFNPNSWASSGSGSGCGEPDNISGGSGCGEPEAKRPGKTTTVRTNAGKPTEVRGSTPALKMSLKDTAKCPNNFYPRNAREHNSSANNANVSDNNGACTVNANSNDNNCVVTTSARRKGLRSASQALDDYEWESADDSPQDYERKLAASGLKSRNDIKERIVRMQADQIKRRRKIKQEQEAKRIHELANNGGILANIWGYITGAKSRTNDHAKFTETINANANANNDATVDANVNNNAANRCARPCPPCPQKDCEPPPFECPCNDVSCPKKLKPKKDIMDVNDIQSGGSTVNIKRGDNNAILDIEVDLKKPKPDLALGCPCGDENCKKKFCNQPQPPLFDICQQAKGPMQKQDVCPDPEERDICDKGQEEPKNCPCADEFCPNKPGGDGYFKFLYPPNDKMKFNEDGCPDEQQIECWVLPNGQVKCKPILSPLHCEVVPPCPCEEWEKKEFDSCDCSGNWWGEEADDETMDEGECGGEEEDDGSCGHQQVPGGLGKVDEYEWDQEDVPCVDIPEGADEDMKEMAEAMKECEDYMAYRNKKTGIMQAAMEAAMEAWKLDKMRREKEKDQQDAKKKKIESYRNEGLDDEEIYDLMCVTQGGQCDIVGDYPIQAACQPPPNDPPGCPCPDLKCPKRAPFDHTMFDMDMSKYKTKKEIKAAERYYKSDAYKTMECELKAPTYRDVGKGYPKAKRCPCPECKEEDQKAWAEVELMKVGPPPECPCKDITCPKKPPKEDEEEVALDDSPCHMRGRYPKQSGCLDVLRCDLIKDPCNDLCVRPEDKKAPPKEEFKCHPCKLRRPMPKQSSCPDYDCNECALVCDDCGCKPTKCEKCESAKPVVVQEDNLCPPCTVPRPFPQQSICKELHPCDPKHPCMCDPGTGEAIDAERCGPCDKRNHNVYPEQTDCPAETHPDAEICDTPEEKERMKALQEKRLKAMKLIDTRTGFGLLEGQAAITCETDESGNCKQGECNPGYSEITINLSDATKARLMPGNPATEGVVEGRGGQFPVDPQKIVDLEQKKKTIEEPQIKCVRVIDYEASINDAGIIDTDNKAAAKKAKTVEKAVKNFRKSMSTMSLSEQEEEKKALGSPSKKAAKRVEDRNNNSDASGATDSCATVVVPANELPADRGEEPKARTKDTLIFAVRTESLPMDAVTIGEEAPKWFNRATMENVSEELVSYTHDALEHQEQPIQRQLQPTLVVTPTEQEAEENCHQSCLFTGIDSPNIVLKKTKPLQISDLLPSEMRPKMKCKERNDEIKPVMRPRKNSIKDQPPQIELSDSEIDDEDSKSYRRSPSQQLFLVETDENGAKILGSVDYAELECGAKRQISEQFSESAAFALEEGSVSQSVELLSQAILSHPEPKSFLERLGIRNFLPQGLWSRK